MLTVPVLLLFNRCMSCFETLQKLPDDPILQLQILFAADTRSNKVNLGIGAYKDHAGKPMVLSCVRKAEQMLLQQNLDKEYLPIQGLQDYISASLQLLFGDVLKNKANIFAMQTVGGTNALRLGAELLIRSGLRQMYVPDPTWSNHNLIFSVSGMAMGTYPYFDPETHGFAFDRLCQAIEKLPQNSVVLLHASCHNPTGVDPSETQWKTLSTLIKQRNLFPFFDIAYQGLGNGIAEDAFAVRHFAEQGHQMLVASSYSKNLGLYGERVGLLVAVTGSSKEASCVASQLKQLMRGVCSMPPLHGARIVKTILQSEALRTEWESELKGMRERIKEMRRAFVGELKARGVKQDLSYLQKQLGIFSFVGLNKDQAQQLHDQYAIYLPSNGRINIAGLNPGNLNYVAESIAMVLKS